jgi:hypothetical protein
MNGTAKSGILCLLVFFSVLLTQSERDSAAQEPPPSIVIGCWNIEFLGKEGMRKDVGHNVAQTAEDLADYIMASEVSILGLEEITDNDSGKNTTMGKALNIVKAKTGKKWEHQLFPKVGKDQCVGVAWNSDQVKMVGDVLKIGVPNKIDVSEANNVPLWNRHPHAVKFSFGAGKTDIVFIVLHMKANTGGFPSPKRKRELEARTLMQELGNVQTKTKDFDIVIAGDTNILNKNEKAAKLYTAFGFKDLNDEDEGSYITGGAPFDRFFVPDDQPEFQGFDQQVFDSEYMDLHPMMTRSEFRKRFSDHFMVKTRVKIVPDDDGN